MAMDPKILEAFKKEHGYSLEDVPDIPQEVRRPQKASTRDRTPEIVGRGCVSLGRGIDPQQKDEENLALFKRLVGYVR